MSNLWVRKLTRRKVLLAIFAIAILGAAWWFYTPNVQTNISYSKLYFANDHTLLRLRLTTDEKYRVRTQLDDIPALFKQATLLYEDEHFYTHNGVNFAAIGRAIWQTYAVRERRIGASTITMQLAKQLWNIDSRSAFGKLVQIRRALQLERHFSKDEILSLYFDLVPYGYNIEGVGAAAWVYFAKPVEQLSELEQLSLVVIPQNPNKRRLADEKRQQYNQQARTILLARLTEANVALAPSTKRNISLPLAAKAPKNLPFAAPHLVNHLAQHSAEQLKIRTTIDTSIQQKVERIARRYIDDHRHQGLQNTSVMVVNHRTREIEALLGSVDFNNHGIHGQVDGTHAKRSPGSTLKPFIYGLAMDQGLIHPNTVLNDQAKRYGGFTPENFDQRFLGPLTATEALITSRNLPAVALQAQLKDKDLYTLLTQAQVGLPYNRQHYGLALGLGGAELTMRELAGLYTALANGGEWAPLKLQKEIEPTAKQAKLLSPEAAWLTLWMLAQNPPAWLASDFTAAKDKNDIAWKTGTSWAFRDAWAIGVSKQHVVLVWVGNFDGSGNPALVGAKAAGPLMFQLFDALHEKNAWSIEQLQHGTLNKIRKVNVCEKTGELYTAFCPKAKAGYFIAGVSPIKTNTVFKQIPVNKQTGLRSCWFKPEHDKLTVFEFWPSDYEFAFQAAGVSILQPPKFDPSCKANQRQHLRDDRLHIESPYLDAHYILQPQKNTPQTIAFGAKLGSDAQSTHWFINGSYIATTAKHQTYHWPMQTGKFVLEAVDDLGSADSVRFSVGLP